MWLFILHIACDQTKQLVREFAHWDSRTALL
jgi:hypothetical protein